MLSLDSSAPGQEEYGREAGDASILAIGRHDGAAQPIAKNVAAAGIAGAIQISIFNPLDALRIRWQVSAVDMLRTDRTLSMRSFCAHIVRDEGWWRGLHSVGLVPNIIGVSASQGLRMGCYPAVRDTVLAPGAVDPVRMAFAGLVSGSLGYLSSAPLWLMKTRMQASAQLKTTPSWPHSLGGFWLGCGPLVVRGALLSAGQMSGYDGTKKMLLLRQMLADGPILHVLSATAAALCAATLSAPADVVQTRLQSLGQSQRGGMSTQQTTSVSECVAAVVQERGVLGFFRGWTVNVARLAPTFIIGTTIYEQARRVMGLGYMD